MQRLEHPLLGTVPPVVGLGQLETLLGLSGRFSAEGVVLVAEAGQVIKKHKERSEAGQAFRQVQ